MASAAGTDLSIQKEKRRLRAAMLTVRDSIDTSVRRKLDERRWAHLAGHPIYQRAERIFTYVSFGSEADTHTLILQALEKGKQIGVPKVSGGRMDFYRIMDMDCLIPGTYGILEPSGTDAGHHASLLVPSAASQDILILPGIAFDRTGGRIGYGGGYYDRYLSQYPDLFTIAFAYDAQIADHIPMQTHDRAADALLTESGLTFIQEGGYNNGSTRVE